MKSLHAMVIGLVASSAVMLIGAGAASADTFCKAKEDPCGNAHTLPFEVVALDIQSVFLFSGGMDVKCHSELVAQYTKNRGSHLGLEGDLEKLKFTGCAGLCSHPEVEVRFPPFDLLAKGLPQSITMNGSIRFLFRNCLLLATCEYSTNEVLFDFIEGNPAHLRVREAVMKLSSGSACPEHLKWDALYAVTTPKGLLALAALP